jgi:hypothetical protein
MNTLSTRPSHNAVGCIAALSRISQKTGTATIIDAPPAMRKSTSG